MTNIKAVLWDMDGTLIDSETFYFGAWVKVLENYSLKFDHHVWMREMSGKTSQQVYEVLTNNYGLNAEWELFFQHIKAEVLIQYQKEKIQLIPFAKELINDFKKRGMLLGLVTSSYKRVMDKHLTSLELYDLFDFFVTKDDVVNPKPHPEPYLLAQNHLSHLEPHEILVFEDSVTGVTSAVAAGLKCVGIQSDSFIRESLPTPLKYSNLRDFQKSMLPLIQAI